MQMDVVSYNKRATVRGESSQFLQVTVWYVVATPFGNGIELDAMGELHLFVLGQALDLLSAFALFCCACSLGSSTRVKACEIVELKVEGRGRR